MPEPAAGKSLARDGGGLRGLQRVVVSDAGASREVLAGKRGFCSWGLRPDRRVPERHYKAET
jgi:hypothetical protein